MRRIRKYLYGVLAALALLGGAACSGEEPLPEPEPTPIVPEPEEDDGILEAVTITIGASNTIETRFNDDPNALEHEFMNSLIAFIVNGDTIEAVINATETEAFQQSLKEMDPGNVNLYSQKVDITPGTKTIYAFANMDKVKRIAEAEGNSPDKESFEATLKTLKVGAEWPKEYENAVIDNPAATVNFEGDDPGFIPMSLKEEVTVTVAGQSVSLSLVRLVSRVSVKLYNGQGTQITVSGFKMEDFADRVNLFESETAPANITYKSYPFDEGITSEEIKIDHNKDAEIATFYINETLGRKEAKTPFDLSLTVGEKVMTGQTVCTSIPRNHILPLTLNLSNTHVGLKVEAQVAPIGGYPFNVYLGGDGFLPVNGNVGNFAVALPEGCVFTVTGTIEGSSGTSTPITNWTWINENENLIETSVNGSVLTGYLAALPEQEAQLSFSITTPVAGEGTLTIQTKAVGDAPWSGGNEFGPVTSGALRSWSQPVRWSEFIPLRMANPE